MRILERQESEGTPHIPVLRDAVLEYLLPAGGESTGWVVDGTLGAGGHAALVLAAAPKVRVLGVDQDASALELARTRLSEFGDRVHYVHGRFSEIIEHVRALSLPRPIGILLDIGASSMQLDRPERGFSFMHDGPLDMRMDPNTERTAADVVNRWDEEDLADLFFHEGGEKRARRVAHAVVDARRRAPFLRTGAFADLVERTLGRSGKTHPATRVFQALRRVVNEEGDELVRVLGAAEELLPDRGRLVVISFHSGEDGQVKRFLRERAREGEWALLTKKARTADNSECRENRRARSAVLRAAERIDSGHETPGDLGDPGDQDSSGGAA